MPHYACDNCDAVFRSKNKLRDHVEDCTGSTAPSTGETVRSKIPAFEPEKWARQVRSMFTLRNAAIMFGVLMMATLFLGTASFMSSTAPGSNSPTGNAAAAETTPPTGVSIQSQRDIPNVPGQLPDGVVSQEQLSTDAQIHLMTRGTGNGPAAIIHYNCDGLCPQLVQELGTFAQNYQGRVYAMPNDNIDSQIVMTAFRQPIERMDTFNATTANNFVCNSFPPQQQPFSCEFQ